MTKKDFFRILIKLFGLYVLINFAFSIVNTISNLFIDSYGLGFFEVGIYLGMLILLFLLFVVLV
ncbi:MAG: hypothetical protein ACI97N_001522, partial [Cognaticolwellia sp.]